MSNLESYPPVFRHLINKTQLKNSIEEEEEDTQVSVTVPVVDLQCLNNYQLEEACKKWGIFCLVNHGIPPSLLSRLEGHAKSLFSLPFESKQALLSSSTSCPMSYFWGTPALTPYGDALKANGRGALINMNCLEGLNVPLSQLVPPFQNEDPVLGLFR